MAPTRETLRQVRRLRAGVGAEADGAVAALTGAWARSWADLDRRWVLASAAVAALAVELGRWPRPWELVRLPALGVALDGTDDTLTDLQRRTDKTITESAAAAVVLVAAAEVLILASQLPAVERAATAAMFTARLPARLVELVTATTATRVHAAVLPLRSEMFNAVQRAVVRGARPGPDTPRQLAAAVRSAFDGGLTRAAATANTETLDAARDTARTVDAATGGLTDRWIWFSALDRTSCVACWVMHGTVFAATEPGPLGHVACRCVRLPLLAAPDGRGQPSGLPDAQRRFSRLPEADQVAILGPARHAMLAAGQIGWSDLAVLRPSSMWRPSYQPRTVADLQRIARRRTT